MIVKAVGRKHSPHIHVFTLLVLTTIKRRFWCQGDERLIPEVQRLCDSHGNWALPVNTTVPYGNGRVFTSVRSLEDFHQRVMDGRTSLHFPYLKYKLEKAIV